MNKDIINSNLRINIKKQDLVNLKTKKNSNNNNEIKSSILNKDIIYTNELNENNNIKSSK